MTKRRIINVSNRLPIKLSTTDGDLSFHQSEGGLATGLSRVLDSYKNTWIGWPGASVKEEDYERTTDYLAARGLFPIYLTDTEINNFYEGFSNDTLWPLFHYFPTYSNYKEEYWDAYVSVNRKYADAILKEARPDDIIWVHDYQLMLVPAMVRAAAPAVTIGYFQHIPFPDYEIFRSMPWKEELLAGLLGADTIGFQTESDVRHFLSTVSRVLDLPANENEITYMNRTVSTQAFPISIDYQHFRQLADHETTELNVRKIKKIIDTPIALSVDRLDYSKGILHRLRAFELFLEQHPEWRQKVTLIHVIVPSRDTVGSYKQLKEEMDRLISNINGKYSVLGWQPIHHFYQSFTPYMLSAFYKSASLALVTPLRDGMNLVCKEYVAANVSLNGMLLLSETAGAAAELKDAIIVNPNNTRDFANKIHEGLTMSAEEKKKRMNKMRQIISGSDIFLWASKFMSKLLDTVGMKKNKSHQLIVLQEKGNIAMLKDMPLAS